MSSKPIISVSVRELVEFALRTGDLGGERDFVGRGRALAGTRGHQRIQRSRPVGYQKELPLAFELECEEFTLRIQGRLDGVMVSQDNVILEEIKTVTGSWDGVADPLHWGQVKVYAFIYAQEHRIQEIRLRLSYLDLDSAAVTEFEDHQTLPELSAFFEQTTASFLEWVRARQRWCRERDQSIRRLEFPFKQYRAGQRELAVASYKTIAQGKRLFAEAPTGIGKTISVLFSALKALGEGKVERIFYLTARGTGRAAAEKAFADLRHSGLAVRTLTLTAKEKLCVQNGQPCELSTCPLARGYYDRRRPAMTEALMCQELDRTRMEQLGQKYQVCPFELALDLSAWVDAVICDYNYVMDPRVYLRRHFGDGPRDYVFLVDEAHNLVDRAREMFSAELDSDEIQSVRRLLKKDVPGCARALAKLQAAIRECCRPRETEDDLEDGEDVSPDLFTGNSLASSKEPARKSSTASDALIISDEAVGVFKTCPPNLIRRVEEALEAAEKWLVKNEAAHFRQELLEAYFRLYSFLRTAEQFDERFILLAQTGRGICIKLLCLDPSLLLDEALARGRAAVLFSATFRPIEYYRQLLGGGTTDSTLQLASPFPEENLAVLVQEDLPTHFKARASTLDEVVQTISAVVQERSGNYLVYLPSYQYLTSVHELFQKVHPELRTLRQQPRMGDSERVAFLDAFKCDHQETLVGFAVMGGIFGEGIDLVGERLIGAIVIGVGLPQISVERNVLRAYFQEKAGDGFAFAYLVPGMNRVLQATGRVIRSETDRGVLILIDRRFSEWRYRQLFPPWWQSVRIANCGELRTRLRGFWGEKGDN